MELETPTGDKLFDRSGKHKVTSKQFKHELSVENKMIQDSLTKTAVIF